MRYLRTSLLLVISIIGVAMGAAGGCAESATLPANTNSAGGGRTSSSSGGFTIIPTDGGSTDGEGGVAGSATTTTSVACDAGLKRCGPSCVDTLTNPLHCGDCGRPCLADANVCSNGTCICPADTHAVCDGICSDLSKDLSNCGACGNFCASDRICSAGKCVCDPSKATFTECSGKCVDLKTDVVHCGACNETTTPTCDAAQVCTDGACASNCKEPTVKCGPKCVNLQTDSANCSECGKACDSTRMCSGGTCVCATGRTLCGTSTCSDLQTDSKNCGKCGAVCQPGTSCAKGVCMCDTTAQVCTVPASTGGGGAGGVGGAGSKTTTVCADITQHHDHCGACNKPCTALETCVESKCACNEPYVTCGTANVCTDLQANNSNCGTCGNACDATTEHCDAGKCVCTEPYLDCGAGCIDTSKTKEHCGECNKPCTGNQLCSNSTCVSGDIRISTKMQSLPASAEDYKNSVTVSLHVCNIGSSTASLKSAVIKYWYSIDGAGGTQIALSPYSSLAGVTVEAVEVNPMRGTTDYALVTTLPATASLPAGACFEEIQLSVHAGTSWVTGYDLTNDWSYLAKTTFTLNDHVTMYIGTAKMWGIEPQ